MRIRIMGVALSGLLVVAGPAAAQTEKIQKQIEQKLDQVRKERAGLEELLAQALKNNADIRVAESKVREAEAELYRARMQVLAKVTMLRTQLQGAKASADDAAARYAQTRALNEKGVIAVTELFTAAAVMQKLKSDAAVIEAELDALVGKPSAQSAAFSGVFGAPWSEGALYKRPDRKQSGPGPGAASSVQPAMIEKVRKALDAPFKMSLKGEVLPEDVLVILRHETKGVNVSSALNGQARQARAQFDVPVPLGAAYQWAEDTFGWRFIVRDYGIVACERDHIPPDAVLLLELWRHGPPAGSTADPERK